jgi:hypothetical protein
VLLLVTVFSQAVVVQQAVPTQEYYHHLLDIEKLAFCESGGGLSQKQPTSILTHIHIYYA